MSFLPSLLHSYFLTLSILTGIAIAQVKPAPAPPSRLVSPEVHSDDRVTFRFLAPNALDVKLEREGADPVSIEKDDQGVWTVTTARLPPDYYGYSFIADGARSLDASNPSLVPNLISPENSVHVPGPPTLPWELNDVPHGEIIITSITLRLRRMTAIITCTRHRATIGPRRRLIQCSISCTASATMPADGQRSGART